MHDLLLAKKGIAAPSLHPLRLTVERHKARIHAEFTKSRIKRGFSSVEELRRYVQDSNGGNGDALAQQEHVVQHNEKISQDWSHPRWVRVNTLKTSLDEQLATTFAEYTNKDTLYEIVEAKTKSSPNRIYHIDKNVPNLIALPPDARLSTLSAYQQGLLIVQDKASCFPAYLLDPQPEDGDYLDACAAPGNKTTQLAASLRANEYKGKLNKIWACERDEIRAITLQKMVRIAGADGLVIIKPGQDFLKIDALKEPWNHVSALLLDPSCSGSGIVGRDETLPLALPSKEASIIASSTSKRKRRKTAVKHEKPAIAVERLQENPARESEIEEKLQKRLAALQDFQTRILIHAFSFPRARKITYSTCSVHATENEAVVLKALSSPIAKSGSWRLLPREDQVIGMKIWPIRGDVIACRGVLKDDLGAADEVAQACIRCNKGTREGTQGFFVAAFVRNATMQDSLDLESEWEGCAD